MPKPDPVDEKRIADAIERTKRQQCTNAKKGGRTIKATPKRQTRGEGAVGTGRRVKPAAKKTKQETCLDLLRRREGTTIEELQAETGWQQHSVRGFLAGAVKKKFGLMLLSEKPDAGPRRYRISNML